MFSISTLGGPVLVLALPAARLCGRVSVPSPRIPILALPLPGSETWSLRAAVVLPIHSTLALSGLLLGGTTEMMCAMEPWAAPRGLKARCSLQPGIQEIQACRSGCLSHHRKCTGPFSRGFPKAEHCLRDKEGAADTLVFAPLD